MTFRFKTKLGLSLMLMGCMQGPTGPAGKDGSQGSPGPSGGYGGSNFYTDSIIVDDLLGAYLLLKLKQDSTFVVSPKGRSYINRLDTSVFVFDSAWGMGLKTRYQPRDWYAYLEYVRAHNSSSSDSANWLGKYELDSLTRYVSDSEAGKLGWVIVGTADTRYVNGIGIFGLPWNPFDGKMKIFYG